MCSDPSRLQQILTNLIGNAIKFTSEGRITIEVQIKEQTEDALTLDFTVIDTGIGIAVDRQALIFEAFTQADGSVTRDFGGTGLGLTISNQLVSLLGGTTLKVKSREGEGSTFSFELSFKQGGKICTEPKAEKIEKQTDTIPACRILLVEDNPVNIKLASRLLEKQGHRVVVAENGKLAVEAVCKDEFDLVLMDMQMPVMDGLEATREIRRLEKEEKQKAGHVPIVAMTANAMKGDREQCLESGMDDYITKPININVINRVIGQWSAVSHRQKMSAEPDLDKTPATVLVVDDNPVNSKLLSVGLKREGYRVLTGSDGLQAIDLYQQENPDIILMDIQMPEMDGLEATRRIRKHETDRGKGRILIIAVTAHANSDECLAAGMDRAHKKPVKVKALAAEIKNWLKPE